MKHIPEQLHWESAYTQLIRLLEQDGHIRLFDGVAKLTEEGRNASEQTYSALFSR